VSFFSYEKRLKPILKWAGGKSNLLPQLTPFFPENFKRYIEPFLGGGAVFLALKPGKVPCMINDYNKDVYNLYSVIQKNPHELMKILDIYQEKYSKEFYYDLRSSHNSHSKTHQAARTLFLNKTGFNGLYRLNSKGNFNVPFGKRTVCPILYEQKNLLAVSEYLKTATLINKDFEEIINFAQEGDFIYCDPPYEPISQSSSFNFYNGKSFLFSDQQRLYHACRKAAKKGAFIAVSNSTSPNILNLYQDWEIHKVLANRFINSQGKKRGKIEEILALKRS
jgi:DNA adenine methylase